MSDQTLKAYTDGSHKNGRLGWGFVVVHNDKEIERHCGLLEGPQSLIDQSNMAVEMAAAMRAASWAKDRGVQVEIISDQDGVECWATGEWRRKNEWTKKYHAYMANHGHVAGFGSVQAHCNEDWNDGHEWNSLADDLAKAATRQEPSGEDVSVPTEDQLEEIRAVRQFYQEEKDTKQVCQDVAPAVADIIGGEVVAGKWPGGEYGFRHQWVVLEDGTIVDPTADQFEDGYYERSEEGTRVVPPEHDQYDSYVAHDDGEFVPMSEFLNDEDEETEGHCGRCCASKGPDGIIKPFEHILGGICFRCWGSGDEENPAEPPQKAVSKGLV